MRGTGGNRFIPGDADDAAFVAEVRSQLAVLRRFAEETGRRLDLGEVSIDTKRVGDRLSVSVTADLLRQDERSGS